MNIDDKFQKRSTIGMARTNVCGPFKMSRTKNGYPKTLHFLFSDPDHIESLRKANTIKRG